LTANSSSNKQSARNQKPRKVTVAGLIIPLLIVLGLVGFTIYQGFNDHDLHQGYKMMMDTSVELRFSPGSIPVEQLEEEVFAEIDRLEKLFSRSIEGSDVSKVNEAAGLNHVIVSPEVLHVTEKAVSYAELTEGSFDPTIAPLVDLWGFYGQEYRVPNPEELERIVPFVDYTALEIDRDDETLFLTQSQMGLELGGIAKGFIVDQAMGVLKKADVEHAFINAGGDIGLIGSNPDGEPWRIGITNPRKTDQIIAVLSIIDCSVVTSGDYERSFEEEGEKYHHILDPETGMPADELASVTIVADTTLIADVLSTAVFVLGPQQGLQLIEDLDEAEGVLITPDLEVLVSSGLKDKVEIDEQ